MGRYTDMLYVEQPTEQIRNAEGDLVNKTEPTLKKWGLCREVPAGENNVLQTAEGVTLAYKSVVYLHALTPAVPVNSVVKVFNAYGAEVLHGQVLRYKQYKHYGKVWI